MSSASGTLALVLSMVALAVAGYGLLGDRSEPADLEPRLAAIEDQMTRIERVLEERGMPSEVGPSLSGLGASAEAAAARSGGAPGATLRVGEPDFTKPDDTPSDGKAPEELAALVDEAVEKKAAEMQVMRNKKPPMDLFAKTLELTDLQREAAGQEIVRAQNDIKSILEIPAEDGTVFLEELVEVFASGMANPGKNAERSMKFFGRLLSEKVPGTDETYATRIDGVKRRVSATFKRDWNEKQYATFEMWQMDPTEVQGLEGSPWTPLGERIVERAKQLGAKIPEVDDR